MALVAERSLSRTTLVGQAGRNNRGKSCINKLRQNHRRTNQKDKNSNGEDSSHPSHPVDPSTKSSSSKWQNNPCTTGFLETRKSTTSLMLIFLSGSPGFWVWGLSSGPRSNLPLQLSLICRSKTFVRVCLHVLFADQPQDPNFNP